MRDTLTSLLTAALGAGGMQLPSRKPGLEHWPSLAASGCIVSGKVVRVAAPQNAPKTVQIEINRVLRGDVRVRQANFVAYDTPVTQVMVGKPYLFFARSCLADGSLSGLQDTTFPLFVATSETTTQAAADEAANQEAIAHLAVTTDNPTLYARLRRDIQTLLKTREEEKTQQVVEAMRKLGAVAVPSLVALMDDYRPLPDNRVWFPTPLIRSPNSPRPFESRMYLTPEKVIDLVGGLLTSITGVSFGSLFRNVDDPLRRQAYFGWRVYVYYNYPNVVFAKPKGE